MTRTGVEVAFRRCVCVRLILSILMLLLCEALNSNFTHTCELPRGKVQPFFRGHAQRLLRRRKQFNTTCMLCVYKGKLSQQAVKRVIAKLRVNKTIIVKA